MDYLEFYQTLSPKNITSKTLDFIEHLRLEEWVEVDRKQELLNMLVTQSAINHQAKKEKDTANLKEAITELRRVIERNGLIEIRILLVVSNNVDQADLNPDIEINKLEQELNIEHGTIFKIRKLYNKDIHALVSNLIRFKPHVLHFTGHGEGEGIFLSDSEQNISRLMTNETLINIFNNIDSSLRLVFLNCCKSNVLADEIHKLGANIHIISYTENIKVNLATAISTRVYRRLYETKLFKESINLAIERTHKEFNPHKEKEIEDLIYLINGTSTEKEEQEDYHGFLEWAKWKSTDLVEKWKLLFSKKSIPS